MALYRPSELKNLLQSLGVAPKRSLSQNFLIDGNILKKIIERANPALASSILEIGPGPGVLTEALLERGCCVIAIEKDHVFAQSLTRLDVTGQKLTVIEKDVLHVCFDELIDAKGMVIANIPYHITSEIIEKILVSKKLISATLLVQEEVAKRLIAQPGSREFDLLSLLAQYFSIPTLAFQVPKHCFYPIPQVTSSVVHLDIHKRWTTKYEAALLEAVTLCFQHRRKMVTTSLKELYEVRRIEEACAGMNLGVRPDELSCQEWIRIITLLQECKIR